MFETLELRRMLSGAVEIGLVSPGPGVCTGDQVQLRMQTGAPSEPGGGQGTIGEVAPLSAAEVTGLLTNVREEKLARDVYNAMYTQWGSPIFRNIANAEQQHLNAVATLLDRYDVPNPVAGLPAGVFDDPAVQQAYDQFVARGSQSVLEAMRVGVEIERQDIQMLQQSLRTATHRDIRTVYSNLLAASRTHLAAFRTQVIRLEALE